MTLALLKQNVERENSIIKELFAVYTKYAELYNNETIVNRAKNMKLAENSLIALIQQLRILNNALPELVEGVSFYKQLTDSVEIKPKSQEIVNIKYIDETTKQKTSVAIKKKDEMSFLKSLTSHKFSRKADKDKTDKERADDAEKASENKTLKAFISYSNKLF